ncbi:hypothetical protein A4G19_10105 [Pasteurellaceae bacterium Macca]|nr:hypothetical protein [Pasteurellaceae bacterium Macca]
MAALLAQDIDPQIHLEEIKTQRQKDNQNTFQHIALDWYQSKYKKTVIERKRLPKLGKVRKAFIS